MEHVLDNPAWNALISGNKHLSEGNDEVRYFNKQVSPFAAFRENTAANFAQLYQMLPDNSTILFVSPAEIDTPAPWKALQGIKGLQMVYGGDAVENDLSQQLIPLKDEHVPQMQALTKLTNPGPFAERTIDFGHYHGVFEDNRLVAMAGQRLNPFEYAEISAVCTHPDHTGKGYARQLLLHQVRRIMAASQIPFLHVRHDNERAIRVYQSLGFSTRIPVYFYVLKKSDD